MRQKFLVSLTNGKEMTVYADDYSISPAGFVLFLQEPQAIAGTQAQMIPVTAVAIASLVSILTLDSAGNPLQERSGSVLTAAFIPANSTN